MRVIRVIWVMRMMRVMRVIWVGVMTRMTRITRKMRTHFNHSHTLCPLLTMLPQMWLVTGVAILDDMCQCASGGVDVCFCGSSHFSVVINVQGDEPLVDPVS